MSEYRDDARREVKRAKAELESGDDERLKYVALELRMAMESLVYDRALIYKDEFPPKEYETWQPRRVLEELLEIDSNSDKDSSLAFGIEPSYGNAPEFMEFLGNEKVLDMATLKKRYNALGSYLHILTLKQKFAGAKVDFVKMRVTCKAIIDYLTEILASRVWNVTFGVFATIECMKCGKPLRRRCPRDAEIIGKQCFECGATYKVQNTGNNEASFEPDQVELRCANTECGTTTFIWRNEIRPGVSWTCEVCGGHNAIRLAVYHEPKPVNVARS